MEKDDHFSPEKLDVLDAEMNMKEHAQLETHDKLRNPLMGLSKEELFADVETFARDHQLEPILEDLQKGALVARDPKSFESLEELSESEKELFR